jgi:hypothetical protein
MDCPRCGLISPPAAERCDCGYSFATGRQEGTFLSERDRQALGVQAQTMSAAEARSAGLRDVWMGLLWALAGVIALVALFRLAVNVGLLVFFYGPIVYGLARVGRGFYRFATGRDHSFFNLNPKRKPFLHGLVKPRRPQD